MRTFAVLVSESVSNKIAAFLNVWDHASVIMNLSYKFELSITVILLCITVDSKASDFRRSRLCPESDYYLQDLSPQV